MLGRATPKGISLHIGLNRVDPIHYGGWKGELAACENDARDMETIATSQGFVAQSLLTKAATSTAVLGVMEKVAKELFEDDFFLLTYSGHGGQINDAGNDEPDGLDETWVLFDRQLVDDELYAAWSLFRPSVRVLVLSDSCHGGTMTKAMLLDPTPYLVTSRCAGACEHSCKPETEISTARRAGQDLQGAGNTIRRHSQEDSTKRESQRGMQRDFGLGVSRQPGCHGGDQEWPFHRNVGESMGQGQVCEADTITFAMRLRV